MLTDKMVNIEGVEVISYGKSFGHIDDRLSSTIIDSYWNNVTMGLGQIKTLFQMLNEVNHDILSDKKLINQIKALKPDLLVLTNFPPFRDIVVLPYLLDVPFVMLAPFHDYIGARIPFSLSAAPTQVNGDFHEEGMTFSQRLVNGMIHLAFLGVHSYVTSGEMVSKYAPNRPLLTTDEILRKAELYIVETDHIMDYARPTLPNVKYVGGTAGTPGKPLKEPFKSFMDKSANGVVVVTFGSSVKEFPDYVVRKMVSAFLRLEQNVIWRADLQSPDPGKILTSTWVPQNDLLAHKNLKLLVSSCGANAQYEGLYHAIPTLCLPMFGDMIYNAQRGLVKGFGLKADIRKITSVEFLALMREMLGNDKYKKSIQKASDLYKKLFKLPVNETAYWLDHVMEYGGGYMRSAGQNMAVYQFLSLDIAVVLVLLGMVVMVTVVVVCRCGFRLVCSSIKKPKSD